MPLVGVLGLRSAWRRPGHLLTNAVGLSPTATLSSPRWACLLAGALGLPLGLGLWSLMDGGDLPPVPVPATTLLAIAAIVPLCFAALVMLPARPWAHQPPARALAYE